MWPLCAFRRARPDAACSVATLFSRASCGEGWTGLGQLTLAPLFTVTSISPSIFSTAYLLHFDFLHFHVQSLLARLGSHNPRSECPCPASRPCSLSWIRHTSFFLLFLHVYVFCHERFGVSSAAYPRTDVWADFGRLGGVV